MHSMNTPKRILCFLTALTAAVLFVNAVADADVAERSRRNAALSGYAALEIPNQGAARDAEAFRPLMEKAAKENEVNVFRKVSGWTPDDRPFVAYYAMVTNSTCFFDSFRIKGAPDPALAVRGASGWTMTTAGKPPDGDPIAEVCDILANDACAIASMELMSGSYAAAGTYYIEAPDSGALSRFTTTLESALEQEGQPVELSLSYDASGDYSAGESRDPAAAFLAGLLTFMLIVMAAYCQLSDARRHAIVSLYGGGAVRAWLETGGSLLCRLIAVMTALALVCSFLVPGTSPLFSLGVAAGVALPLGLVLIASLLTSRLTRPRNFALALKGRKNAKGMAAACLVAKAIFCVMLVGMASSVASQARVLQEEQARYGNWAQTSQYGTFFPLTSGYDANDMIGSVVPEVVFSLYPVAIEGGALYVDASQYTPTALESGPNAYRSMTVNPNYLREYPVFDADGEVIEIDERERSWVLLVPESRREEERAIFERWAQLRNPVEGNVWDADASWYGRTVDNPPVDQDVRIIWMADGQEVFAFNPEVGADGDGCVRDPIIEVMALANSVGADRANAVTGNLSSALKIKLTGGSAEEAYESYRGLLEKTSLDDNLKQLTTAEGAIFEILQGFRDAQAQLMLKTAAILVVSLFLAVQSASLLFEANARRAAVKRMYGCGFVEREALPLAAYVALWAIVAAVAMAGPLSFVWEIDSSDTPMAFAAAGALAAVDALVFGAAFVWAEKRRAVDVLKGAG